LPNYKYIPTQRAFRGINFEKFFAILVLFLLVLFTVSLVKAETSAPKPSVPTFTAKLVDNSYDVPESSSVDPYTGQTVITPAHRVENYTVDITIENQVVASDWSSGFCYNVQVKGHFAKDWIKMYMMGEGPTQSHSDSTLISYQLSQSSTDHTYTLESLDWSISTNSISSLPSNSQLDFQVEAMTEYWTRTQEFNSMHFVAEESGWSNTQTVTLPGNVTASPSPTQALPTNNTGPIVGTYWGLSIGEVIIITILAVIAVLLFLLILVFRKKYVSLPNP
jgi:hypothetical protein